MIALLQLLKNTNLNHHESMPFVQNYVMFTSLNFQICKFLRLLFKKVICATLDIQMLMDLTNR